MTEKEKKLSKQAQARKDNKVKPVFFTGKNEEGTEVSLWINTVETDGAPALDGKIGKVNVSLWTRKSSQHGNFLAVFASKAGKDGQHERLGSANVVVKKNGIPGLVINLDGAQEPVWARISKELTDEQLVEFGLKLKLLKERRQEALARKAEPKAKAEEKPASKKTSSKKA